MKQQILEALGYRFKYDPSICEKFLGILSVRYDATDPFHIEFKKLLKNSESLKISENLEENFISELKNLNKMNLKARLKYLEENNVPETVVISYLKLLLEEMSHETLCAPSMELLQGEEKMLDYLFEQATFNDDRTEFIGISNTNFRLVLQTWFLYPEFLKNKEKCSELLECLSLTPFEL